MESSNIIGGSNIFPCKVNFLDDADFIHHIEDYGHIKSIFRMLQNWNSHIRLTPKQEQLINIETRCALLSKPDPCWGYVDGKGVISRCIEGKCPHIYECNPSYTNEYATIWDVTDEERDLYGDPSTQKRYYCVDPISDLEKYKYYFDPEDGIKYKIKPNLNSKTPDQYPDIKRKKVVIGYEETYFGDADNQLSCIYGYVDDTIDSNSIVATKYGATKEYTRENAISEKTIKSAPVGIENSAKKEPSKTAVKRKEVQRVTEDIDEETKRSFEKKIKEKISESYPFTDLSNEFLSENYNGKSLGIILSNKAELAYVSGMFIRLGIDHDVEKYSGREEITLWSADSMDIPDMDCFAISSSFIDSGWNLHSEKTWTLLSDAKVVHQISMSGRDFFRFDTVKGERWGCRNLNGATHIVVQNEDIHIRVPRIEEKRVSLVIDKKRYLIVDQSGEQLGETMESLLTALDSLIDSGEIEEYPEVISDLYISNDEFGLSVRGIGHMKFSVY